MACNVYFWCFCYHIGFVFFSIAAVTQSPLSFPLNRRLGFSALLLLNRRKGLSLCSRSSREGSSFLCTNKETKQRNSPSALFCLLRHFSLLNKKNSLCSNSFLFFTLRKAPPLHGKKVRPDLSAFFATLLRSLGCDAFFFLLCLFLIDVLLLCFACWGVMFSRSLTTLCSALDDKEMNSRAKRCALLGGLFRPPWRSVKKFLHFFVKNKKLFER